MSRIYISRENDPYFNIAAEYDLLRKGDKEVTLFLWQNQPCVVIGRNQNLYAESNVKYLEKNGIIPVRRFSGGGAVYQDLGNFNFTFITKEEKMDQDGFIKVVKNALLSQGISCSFGGRNDLIYNGKKISGHASYTEDGNHMYHGTMMVHVNLEKLEKSLTPSFLKLHSKGIHSVKSRVINLSQINKTITGESVKKALINEFNKEYKKDSIIEFIDKGNWKPHCFNKIKQDKWIYGETPDFDIQVEKKLSLGNVTITSKIEEGLIKDIKIYTDSLLVIDCKKIEQKLIGTLYEEKKIFEKIEGHLLNFSISNDKIC